MRHHFIRHALFVIALMGLLFTLDAALDVDMTVTDIVLLCIVGVAFAYALVRLASRVLRGSIRARLTAVFGINVLGLVPALIMLPVVMSLPDASAARVGSRVVIIWLLSIAAWTTAVLASVAPIRARRRSVSAGARAQHASRGHRLSHA